MFKVNNEEYTEFENLFKAISKIDSKSILYKMIIIYEQSFNEILYETKLLLRVTILEMLISKNTELTYRLSRHLAVLFGSNKESSKHISDDIKKLYNIRSKFIHCGEFIKNFEYVEKAKHYSRKLIRVLIKNGIDCEKLENILENYGYGDNPLSLTEELE